MELMWCLGSLPAACAINVSAHRTVRRSGFKLPADSTVLLPLLLYAAETRPSHQEALRQGGMLVVVRGKPQLPSFVVFIVLKEQSFSRR